MNIFAKHITLNKVLFVSVLSTRATARCLYDEAMRTSKKKIILDFQDIEFASRSFMDEINYLINNQDQKEFIKVNMNDQVMKMNELVQKPASKEEWDSENKEYEDSEIVTI